MRAKSQSVMSRRLFVSGAAVAFGGSPGVATRAGAAPRGTTRVALPNLPDGSWQDGYRIGAAWTQQLWSGTLLVAGVDGDLTGGIAATATVAQDRSRIDLAIRPDALFSDGTRVAAGDVVASIVRARERSETAGEGWRWQNVRTVEARSEVLVRIELDEPDVSLGATLASHWVPIYPERWIGDGWDDQTGPFPPSSGCFERVSVTPGQIECRRTNTFYQVGRPRLDGVICLEPGEALPRAMELVTGRVELLIDAPLLDVPTLRADPALELVGGPANAISLLTVNLESRAVADRRLRQLLYRAIDREALVAVATANEAVAATSLIEPGHWAGLEDPVDHAGPDEVRAGLQDLGFVPGMELRLVVDDHDASLVNAGVLLQDQFAYAGIALSLELLGREEMQVAMTGGAWDLLLTRRPFWRDPHELIRPWLVTGASGNVGRYAHGRVDYLAELARRARYQEYRGDLYRTIQRIVRDDVPVIPLFFPNYYDAMTNRLGRYPFFPPLSAQAMYQAVLTPTESDATP